MHFDKVGHVNQVGHVKSSHCGTHKLSICRPTECHAKLSVCHDVKDSIDILLALMETWVFKALAVSWFSFVLEAGSMWRSQHVVAVV